MATYAELVGILGVTPGAILTIRRQDTAVEEFRRGLATVVKLTGKRVQFDRGPWTFTVAGRFATAVLRDMTLPGRWQVACERAAIDAGFNILTDLEDSGILTLESIEGDSELEVTL